MDTIKVVNLVQEEIIIYPIKFKMARILKNLTLEEVGKQANLSRKTVSKIEKGECAKISKSTFEKLISVLGQTEIFYKSGL